MMLILNSCFWMNVRNDLCSALSKFYGYHHDFISKFMVVLFSDVLTLASRNVKKTTLYGRNSDVDYLTAMPSLNTYIF